MSNCSNTPITGCLDVTIQESIILPNYNTQNSFNTFKVCGINNYVTRTEVIDSKWSGSGIGIISFVNTASASTPGSFVNSDVKYIRITNFPISATFASIHCIKDNDESVTFKVDPGKSLILSNDDLQIPSTTTSSFSYMTEIKAMAGNGNNTYTGSIQIEYVVASA